MLDADDPKYAPLCGTYLLEDGRAVFVGGVLGSTVLTLHDFGTRRIGTLAESADSAPGTVTLHAGPTLWSHDPPELTCTFAPTGTAETQDLHLQEAGGALLRGTRVPLPTETVRFVKGDVSLAGTLFLSAHVEGGARTSCVVLIHGSGAQTRVCVRVHAEYLARHGIASLAYDKRGAGESSPGPDDFRLLGRDALAGLRAVAQHPRIDRRRIGLCGSSQGGWIAPMAAVRPDLTEPFPKPASPRRSMDADPIPVLEQLGCPALALFGDRDTVVPAVENAPLMEQALHRNGNPHHEVIVMPGANHVFHEADGTDVRRFFPDYLARMCDWIAERAAA